MWPHPTPLNDLMHFLWALVGTKASAQAGFQHVEAAGKAPPPLSLLSLRPFQVNCLALRSDAIKHVLRLSMNSTHSPRERNSYQIAAVSETDPERWNPAPSGECQSVYPADSTLHETQVSRALLMYKNIVRRLPASGGSWIWQKLKTASTRSQISTDVWDLTAGGRFLQGRLLCWPAWSDT